VGVHFVVVHIVKQTNVIFLTPESIRYLDVHIDFPQDSSEELKTSFKGLLSPLLLNSALAAVRAQPPSSANASVAVRNASRALEELELSDADKGE
jgi:peptidyl-prolyl isomerase D